MPGYKNVIKRAYSLFTTTSMLEQYQQGGHGLFRWWGKPEKPGEKPPQACTEQANRVDITKHKRRDIGLPGMEVPNRQAAHGDGSTGTTLSGH